MQILLCWVAPFLGQKEIDHCARIISNTAVTQFWVVLNGLAVTFQFASLMNALVYGFWTAEPCYGHKVALRLATYHEIRPDFGGLLEAVDADDGKVRVCIEYAGTEHQAVYLQ